MDVFPKLAGDQIGDEKIIDSVSLASVSVYKKFPVVRFFEVVALGRVGNHVRQESVFNSIEEQNTLINEFTLKHFCFKHYTICTLVRSAIFSHLLDKDQKIWFEKNIKNVVWSLENPFNIEFFLVEKLSENFNKDLLKELYKVFNLEAPERISEMGNLNLKRDFFRKKIRSRHASLLDIHYLFSLGDRDLGYYQVLAENL